MTPRVMGWVVSLFYVFGLFAYYVMWRDDVAGASIAAGSGILTLWLFTRRQG